MKKSKKKILSIAISSILLILVVIYLVGNYNLAQSTEDTTPPTIQENPDGSTTEEPASSTIQENPDGSTTEEPASSTIQENPDGPYFAVPESPVGTLGLICAAAAAFAAFTIIKKKQRSL